MSSFATMTPAHPRWQEFVDRLSHACICIDSTENARRVLADMTGLDVDASLAALRVLGGGCDCAIVFEIAGVRERFSA